MKKIFVFALLAVALGANAQSSNNDGVTELVVIDCSETSTTVNLSDTTKAAPAKKVETIDPELVKKAEAGDRKAQSDLGMAYFKGKGVKQSYIEALKWFTKAAEQGDAESQYQIGLLYYGGIGVEKSRTKAIEWYKKAAAQGHKEAVAELKYLNGKK